MKWDWWRGLPHFGYGNYGGAHRHEDAVDLMDQAFRQHDDDLELVRKEEDPKVRKILKKQADKALALALREDLRPYKYKIYGPIYCFFARLIFR